MIFPQAPDVYNGPWARAFIDQLERELRRMDRVAQVGYQMSNVTATRVLDADSTSLDEVADVLGTLIDDLKARGMLGG